MMSILTDLQWIEEEKIPDRLLLFARRLPHVVQALEPMISDPVRRILLGLEEEEPTLTSSIDKDIRIAQAHIVSGGLLTIEFCKELEKRASATPHLHVSAARLHVLSSSQRELTARRALSDQVLPYIFPGEIAPLHIELFSVGDRALHVLHVEWLKKLCSIAIEALEMDCQHLQAWLLPFLEVLPEKEMIRKIRKLSRRKRYSGGGIALLAFYGSKLGMDGKKLLENGNQMDELFYFVAKESEAHLA